MWSSLPFIVSIDQVFLSAMFCMMSVRSLMTSLFRTFLRYFVQKTMWYCIEYAFVLPYDMRLVAIAVLVLAGWSVDLSIVYCRVCFVKCFLNVLSYRRAYSALKYRVCALANYYQQTGTGDSRTLDEELASPEPLIVSDYGWFASENNMADLAVAVSNPNEHVSADDVVLTVQGTDSNEQEMFSQDIDLPQIAPDSELVFSYVVGDANSSDAPSDVNVSVNVSDGGWSAYDESEHVEYDVSDVTEGNSDIDGVAKFSGNMSAKGSDVENPDGQAVEGQALVNVVLYDGSGKMLGGYFDIVDMDGQNKVPFEIYAVGAPEYQDYQVFVSPYVFSGVQEQDVSQ